MEFEMRHKCKLTGSRICLIIIPQLEECSNCSCRVIRLQIYHPQIYFIYKNQVCEWLLGYKAANNGNPLWIPKLSSDLPSTLMYACPTSIITGDSVFCKETNYYIIYSYIFFHYFFRKYTVLNWKFCKICSFYYIN